MSLSINVTYITGLKVYEEHIRFITICFVTSSFGCSFLYEYRQSFYFLHFPQKVTRGYHMANIGMQHKFPFEIKY